jgi:hypothetical protein
MTVLAYAPLPAADGGTGRSPAGQAADPGFSEAAMIATAIGRQDAAAARLSGASQRARAWAGLRSGDPGGAPRASGPAVPGRVTITVPPPPEAPPGLWDGSDWIVPLEPGPAADSPTAGGRGRIGDTAPGFRVTFADGSWAWLAAHGQVWRWRRHSGVPRQAEARDLAVGDEVVLIDGDAHKTLLAKLLDAAENIPALALASGWHGHWRATLEHARERAGSYAALTRRLGALGCRVQAETVRLWCTGATIGPDDPADLGRVGEAASDPVLTAQAAEVWRAMRTLRGAHVRAGRRLAALARVIGPAAGDGRLPADEVIDPASGLTAGDLGAAVVVLLVTRIEAAEAVPLVLAGARRQAREPADFLTTGSSTEGMAS